MNKVDNSFTVPGPARMVQEVLQTEKGTPEILLHASVEDMGVEDIPTDRYYSQEFHNLEIEKVWKKVWQMACWTQDIPEPGDTYVYDLADTSVIIVRQPDRSLKAFHNSCLHRGRPLVDNNCTNVNLRCKFHGFTWNLDGSLKSVPSPWDFPQVSAKTHCLPSVRVEEWNGFAFISLNADAPPLLEYLEDVPEHFKGGWDMSKRYKAMHVEKVFPCNWKLTLEAFIESFHIFATHPGSATFNGDEQTQYDIYPGRRHYTRGISMLGFCSGQYDATKITPQSQVDKYLKEYYPAALGTPDSIVPPGEKARPTLVKLVRKQLSDVYKVDLSKESPTTVVDGVWYHMFPNFMLWPTLSYPLVYRFRPLGNDPGQSVMDVWLLFPFEGDRPPSVPPVYKTAEDSLRDVMGRVGVVFDEDLSNLAVMQKGIKANVRGKISPAHYQEARMRHYHRTLMEYINA